MEVCEHFYTGRVYSSPQPPARFIQRSNRRLGKRDLPTCQRTVQLLVTMPNGRRRSREDPRAKTLAGEGGVDHAAKPEVPPPREGSATCCCCCCCWWWWRWWWCCCCCRYRCRPFLRSALRCPSRIWFTLTLYPLITRRPIAPSKCRCCFY